MSYEEIKQMIDEMGKANFDELNIEFPDGVKICMKKNTANNCVQVIPNQVMATSQITNAMQISSQPNSSVPNLTGNDNSLDKVDVSLNVVTSPMVGTFYSSPSPTEKAFVSVSDKVKKGQVLCIIEAMKLMNEIESEFDGEIVEICAKNEGVVEYGMPLFKIRSDN